MTGRIINSLLASAMVAAALATADPAVAAPPSSRETMAAAWIRPVTRDEVTWRGTVVEYDRQLRAPRWSMEDLTPELVDGDAPRAGSFHVPPTVPAEFRRASADFEASGFDRGHCAPAEDFAGDPAAIVATFTTANIAPQDPALNRGIWRQIENRARQLARERGEAYVFTAPIFAGDERGKLPIPSAWCKAILSRTDRGFEVECYLAANKPPAGRRAAPPKIADFRITLDELQRAAGVDLWHGLSPPPNDSP